MRLFHELLELALRNAPVFDAHLDGKPEATALAWANGDGASYLGLARIQLVLLGDEVEGAAKKHAA